MPIKRENRALYPKNWSSYIRPSILKRAGDRCEGSPGYSHCRAENSEPHPETKSIVVLTIAHLDHNPANCDGMEHGGPMIPKERSNLRAWCQRCHLIYDAKHHARTATETRQRRIRQAGQRTLF